METDRNSPVQTPAVRNWNSYYNFLGKETQVGIGYIDLSRRFYDPSIGRFMQVDPVTKLQENQSVQTDLLIDGADTIGRTASNDLEFSFNSFHSSGAMPYGSSTWSGGCDATMADWITGSGPSLCVEDGNQFPVMPLGYNASFCRNFCSAFSSNFTLETTTVASPDYSWDNGGVFSHVTYRGSFGTSDPTTGRTDCCPQNTGYCL